MRDQLGKISFETLRKKYESIIEIHSFDCMGFSVTENGGSY